MLYFPQISTGCLAQFPIRKQQVYPCFVNDAVDGRQFRAPDPDGSLIRWELRYVNLSDDEKRGIEELFAAVQGRLRTFVFVDPAANLLASTGDLNASEWNRAAGLTAASNFDDPFGGTKAWRVHNASAATAAISQAVSCPVALRYCLSAYVRSADVTPCALVIGNAAGQVTNSVHANASWMRLSCSGIAPDSQGAITFGLEIPAGTTIDVFGIQVDAQPNPSPYRASISGGVFPNTRFEDDVLQVRTDGPNNHALTIRLVSRERS